jgi:hypothetical protein
MRSVLGATLLIFAAGVCGADDPPKAPVASGTYDGKKIAFPEKGIADGVRATVGLLESCSSDELYNADEFKKAVHGDHIRLVFAKPITVTVMSEKIEVSELVFRRPLETGVFWVRGGEKWRRFTKYRFEKEKPFAAWLQEAVLAD